MRRSFIAPFVVLSILLGTLFYAASGRVYHRYEDSGAGSVTPPAADMGRRMVDMTADDSYLIEKGDSTIFILVGNFAAHHNGTVILADSAVRYSNQSFECFGNVLINQNDTYAYGERAEYNRDNSTATLYSMLVKVVDGDAVMYTYHCTFDTAEDTGRFFGGCYVDKGDSHLEAQRGYYNTKTHDLIAVESVEMRDETYIMTSDSVIFNTQTEDARYFRNTNIWNDKDEYLFANEGSYTKAKDLHYLTRDAYILSPEREIWSDTIEYYRTAGHIIGRRNIQMDDTTQKVMGFADYGEWWDEPGNALFTRRPSMINYDPTQPDSLFLRADTLWLYTIPVPPPGSENETEADAEADASVATDDGAGEGSVEEGSAEEESQIEPQDSVAMSEGDGRDAGELRGVLSDVDGDAPAERGKTLDARGDKAPEGLPSAKGDPAANAMRDKGREQSQAPQRELSNEANHDGEGAVAESEGVTEAAPVEEEHSQDVEQTDIAESAAADTVVVDSMAVDSVKALTAKQLRYRAKLEKRRVRDSVRGVERALRDTLKAIKQAEKDSIQHIKDSLLNIKLDTIIARRRAHSAELADMEAARLERIKQQSEERRRRKIDKAKARALKRGKEYTGEDYVIDTLAQDSVDVDLPIADVRDSMERDSLGRDSLMRDSLAMDSSVVETPFPEDSVYKMIKAYRNVRIYRSDSQMVCDSLVMRNTDSIIRLYIEPVMWQEGNQINSDSMAIYTRDELISKAHFMGDPIMGMEIDTMYYNQVKGKDMISYFADGKVYRNDVDGNAQTIYYMQQEDGPEVTALMYIESAAITFYLDNGEIDKIAYKQNPTYVLYPMDMIPETQKLRLPDFDWYYDRRPERDMVFDRALRPSRRDDASTRQKPRFKITDRIDYDRRRLVENRMWEDRVDELTPDVVEWRNTRTSYRNRE